MKARGADGIAVAPELPVAVIRVGRDVGDGVDVLVGVHVAECIATRSAFLEIRSEERSGQGRFGIAEKGLLLDRLHCCGSASV